MLLGRRVTRISTGIFYEGTEIDRRACILTLYTGQGMATQTNIKASDPNSLRPFKCN